jgi:hypothetical protein
VPDWVALELANPLTGSVNGDWHALGTHWPGLGTSSDHEPLDPHSVVSWVAPPNVPSTVKPVLQVRVTLLPTTWSPLIKLVDGITIVELVAEGAGSKQAIWHANDPAALIWPDGHVTHEPLPAAAEKVLLAHELHSGSPAAAYSPAWHWKHTPVPLKIDERPAAQSTHWLVATDATLVVVVPAGHDTHASKPVWSAK